MDPQENVVGENIGDELFIDENDHGEVIDTHLDDVNNVVVDEQDDEELEEQANGEEDANNIPAIPFEDDSKARFQGHEPGKSVFCIALNPIVEHIIVSGGEDNMAYIWNGQTGEVLADLPIHNESVISCGFNFDGTLVATADMNGIINVCETEGHPVQQLDAEEEVTCMVWHPKGNCIIAGTISGLIWMWMIPNGAISTFAGHEDAVNNIMFTPDGKNIVSVSEDGTLIKWNPKTAQQEFRVGINDDRFHQSGISSVACHPEKSIIVSGGRNGTLRIINSTNGKLLQGFDDSEDSIEAITFNAKYNLMAVGSVDGTIKIYNTDTFSKRATLSHEDAVTKLEFSHNPDNSYLLYSSSMDSTIKICDARTSELINTWKGHQAGILDFVIASDGKTIVTASDDSTCGVFFP